MADAVKNLTEALEKLNAELDAYWNDPSQAGARPPEVYIQSITAAQQECNTALAAYRAAGEGESDGPIHSWLSGLDGRAAEFERRQDRRQGR